jgi:hypothetical protein
MAFAKRKVGSGMCEVAPWVTYTDLKIWDQEQNCALDPTRFKNARTKS